MLDNHQNPDNTKSVLKGFSNNKLSFLGIGEGKRQSLKECKDMCSAQFPSFFG